MRLTVAEKDIDTWCPTKVRLKFCIKRELSTTEDVHFHFLITTSHKNVSFVAHNGDLCSVFRPANRCLCIPFAGQNHPFQHLTSFSIKMKKKVKTSKNKINTQNGVHQGVHMNRQILPYCEDMNTGLGWHSNIFGFKVCYRWTDRQTNSLTPYTGVCVFFISSKFATSLLASLAGG